MTGCHHPTSTAVSLAPHVCDQRCSLLHGCHKDPEGIPFYLPKPLLIVSKNFRNIEDAKVGLTDSAPIPNAFDDQAKYADLNARTNFNFDGTSSAARRVRPGRRGAAPAGGGATDATVKKAIQSTDPTSPVAAAASNVPPASTATKSGAYTYSQNAPNVSPHEVPSDGLAPNTFFTYHIVFVPDLTQKYGLKIKGGVGEIRAAMNLVNGWQFTGLGPYYMKDSSTAQNVLAGGISARLGGQAVQDVLKGVAGLTAGGRLQSELPADHPQIQQLAKTIEGLRQETHPIMTIPNYAEIHVYEPRIGLDGQMEWTEIVNLSFDRSYVGAVQTEARFAPPARAGVPTPQLQSQLPGAGGTLQSATPSTSTASAGGIDPELARKAVAGVLGIPADSPALAVSSPGGRLQAGAPSTADAVAAPSAAVATPAPHRGLGLFHHKKTRGNVVSRTLSVVDNVGTTLTGAGGITNPNAPATSRPVPPNLGAPSAPTNSSTGSPGTSVPPPPSLPSTADHPTPTAPTPPNPSPSLPPALPEVEAPRLTAPE